MNPQGAGVGFPTGTVTFFFSDVEGSTRLLQADPDRWPDLLDAHHRLTRKAITTAGGVVVRTEGDAFFAVFEEAAAAVEAASAVQRAHHHHSWPDGLEIRVRIGLHTGTGRLGGDDYVGIDVHRAARVAAAGHGGQVVISDATRALAAADLPTELDVIDLGEHRLKDLDHPMRLFQISIEGLPAAFPPLRTADARIGNLPEHLTSFVPRRELDRLVDLVDSHRLVTLTGPGGTGKSRLAVEAARALAHRFDAVQFIALAPVDDPDLVTSRILSTLGAPPSRQPPEDQLAAFLGERHWLLVLDNFEQILEAAPLVAHLLATAPRLSLIVTSRAPLQISGEQEFPVPPLRLPGAEDLEDLDRLQAVGSVALFVDRARAVRPDFALDGENAGAVAEIVLRLDGLPLAVELAAARTRLLTPTAMLRRLPAALDLSAEGGRRDLPHRQQTLRNAIGWSHELLPPPTRELFRHLAVFRGGATLEAIEAVCGGEERPDLLPHLAALVDHSLLYLDHREDEPRYAMLETIRAFAAEQLAGADDGDGIRDRHLRFYRDLATTEAAGLTTEAQGSALRALDVERDNLRAALNRAIASRAANDAASIAASLWRYWHMRGPLHEGREYADRVAAMEGASPRSRIAALGAAGGLAYWAGDMATGQQYYEEAVALARQLDDPAVLVTTLYDLSFTLSFQGDGTGAEEILREALQVAEEHGDHYAAAKVLWALGNSAYGTGHNEAARDYFTRSLAALQGFDDTFLIGWAHRMLGATLLRLGEPAPARPHIDAGMAIFNPAQDLSGIILHLRDYSFLALLEGDHELALLLAGAVAQGEESSGMGLISGVPHEVFDLASAVEAVGPEEADELRARGRSLSLEAAVDLATGRSRPPGPAG